MPPPGVQPAVVVKARRWFAGGVIVMDAARSTPKQNRRAASVQLPTLQVENTPAIPML